MLNVVLTTKTDCRSADPANRNALIDIAVIRLTRIQFSRTFPRWRQRRGWRHAMSMRRGMGTPDMVTDGTKAPLGPHVWLRRAGLRRRERAAAAGPPWYWPLRRLSLLAGASAMRRARRAAARRRHGAAPVETSFAGTKRRTGAPTGAEDRRRLSGLSGAELDGYEIHMAAQSRSRAEGPGAHGERAQRRLLVRERLRKLPPRVSSTRRLPGRCWRLCAGKGACHSG